MRVNQAELAHLELHPDNLGEFLRNNDKTTCLDIGKSWHAIHYLLNRDMWEGNPPLGDAVLGGKAITKQNFVYGPVRFLTDEEVRKVADALDEMAAFELLERYDADELNEANIYPHDWTDRPEEKHNLEIDYLALQSFFMKAAKAGDAVLLYLA